MFAGLACAGARVAVERRGDLMGLRKAEAHPPITEAELVEWEARMPLTNDALTDVVLRLIAEVRRLRAESLAALDGARVPALEEEAEPTHRHAAVAARPPSA